MRRARRDSLVRRDAAPAPPVEPPPAAAIAARRAAARSALAPPPVRSRVEDDGVLSVAALADRLAQIAPKEAAR